MAFEYYYIVIVLVVLKIGIWSCVLYFRAQRIRTARAQRHFVIVDSRSTGQLPHPASLSPQTNIINANHSDRSAILNFEEMPAMSQGPPSYAEAMSHPPCPEDKPPAYSQVVPGHMVNQDGRVPIPSHFTPPAQENTQ